ncbi:MAG TPA: cell envelope integrity protein CreD [Woeseiaceae bacterium]|nr:cell envelope integrity protein CreD [Woeseiaceae bacterium]
MQTESPVSSIAERLRESVSLKMAVVGFLILILLIPVAMLRGLVEERSHLRETAAADIMRGWGGPQLVAGPVLMIPARVVTSDSHSRRVTDTRLNVLPETLDIEVDLESQVLYRGIHEVPVYRAKARITGVLRVPEEQAAGPSLEALHPEKAFVALALTDAGATRSAPVLRIGGREIPFEAGGALQNGWPPHMLARVGGIVAAAGPGARLPFEIDLDFTGGEALHVLPLGDKTNVTMRSAWPSPSFTGRYLPHHREVGDDGFVAEWTLSGLGRPLPPVWLDGTLDASTGTASAVGVEMYNPVDLYQKTLRATKYAMLFIGLSFAAYFLFETMGRLHLHPMQYLLVGFANALFYLLLLSLAEHTGFGIAYILSAGASVVLIAGYSRSVLGATKGAGVMAALLMGLYLFLYLVLQAEDYAMLAGALGLWIILASIMFVTRHVDWYRPRAKEA